jgi:hypothetical protein
MKLKHLAVLLALSTVAADCPFGDKDSTSPSSDPIVGTWNLQTVNGASLPAPYYDGDANTTVSAGQAVVNGNSTFSWSETRANGNDAVAGTWSRSGDTYTFNPAEQPGEETQTNGSGTLSGSTFTLTVPEGTGSTVRVYQKAGS